MQHHNIGLAQINLLTSDSTTLQQPHIVFGAMSLTASLSLSLSLPLPTRSRSSSSNTNVVLPPRMSVPCLFSALLDWYACENHNPILSSSVLESEARFFFGISLSSFPMTVCVTHGHVGFLPLEYVRMLPEYTCTTRYQYPNSRVVHTFEDCNLLFPPTTRQNARTSRPLEQLMNGDSHSNNNMCYRCCKYLVNVETYMYRDNPYCSRHCRYAAHVAHCLHDRMMKF